MCGKDYNLLRPFDLEAAKRGEKVTDIVAGTFLRFISGPDVNGRVCVECLRGFLAIFPIERLRMAPLCWVEGRPVYKGDVLYDISTEEPRGRVVVIDCDGTDAIVETHGYNAIDFLTWTPPKVKREGWINIYKGVDTNEYVSGDIHKTKHLADMLVSKDRIACIHVEWEE